MTNLGLIKKLHIIIVSALLMSLFMQVSIVSVEGEIANNTQGTELTISSENSQEKDRDTEKVLDFLRDVFQLDIAKYEATLRTKATNYWPLLGGIAQTTGQYRLDSTGLLDSTGQCGKSILTVSFTLWDEELISCSFYEVSQGPPLYSKQPATNLKDATSVFLQNYQMRTGDTQLTQMENLLNAVEVKSNATKTTGNLKLTVSAKSGTTLFTWSNTLNDAIYSQLSLEYRDGQLSSFGDNRKFYKLGSSEVNISKEEAVSIALKRVETYSYRYQDKEITDLTINEKLVLSQPHLLNKTTNPMELYPCWIVDLGLDDVYPGNIAYIQVWLWADSGEPFICRAMSYGGYLSDPNSMSEENTQTDNNDTLFSVTYIVIAAIAIAIPMGITALALKKRSQ
jgi:hypothetical protein